MELELHDSYAVTSLLVVAIIIFCLCGTYDIVWIYFNLAISLIKNFYFLDIDECTTGVHECNPKTEYCFNKKGTYACHCANGYQLLNGGCEGNKEIIKHRL